jgi:phenylalanyl-tRNA synthetase beta chain
VLSLPPIINSDHSRISVDTKNIFIEITATDKTKAMVTMNMIVTSFSEYCAEPFTIEPVDVVRPDGTVLTTPDLSPRMETVAAELVNRRIGINCWAPKLARMLSKMMLTAEVSDDGDHLEVTIPATRSDVIHQCDIWEDCAISYGYNKIDWIEPTVATIGTQQPVMKLSDQMRAIVAQAGYLEVLTFALCSHNDGFKFLRREDDGKTACVIGNPANAEFEICRINLLSGLLNTIAANKSKALPIRIFEVADVVLLDNSTDTGAINRKRLGALIHSTSPKFEEIQGLLDYVMRLLGVPRCTAAASAEEKAKSYYVTESSDPAFFADLAAADVIYKGQRVGVMGVVHPEVLSNFGLDNPCGALELELEAFL